MIAVAILGVASAFARYLHWAYYDAGWWEAERELWRGEAKLYASAGLRKGDLCNIDQDTGLPLDHPGCMGDVSYDEWMAGHNDHIAQYIRRHGLPKNTFKPWEKDLFNLARFFDDRSRIDVPKRLVAGGPALVSLNGRNGVRLVPNPMTTEMRTVVITAGDVVLCDSNIQIGTGDSDLLWGPDGSRFVVIRSITEEGELYAAYDLGTGRHLRDESRPHVKGRGQLELVKALANLWFLRRVPDKAMKPE